MLRKLLAVGIGAVALVAVSSGTALAGEIRGPGSPTGVPTTESTSTAAPAHTNSICAYSGLNHYHPGVEGELPIRTQSYGQLVRYQLLDPSDPAIQSTLGPGTSCNGQSGFLAGGGE
jgi:hypothetical protein